MHLGVRFGKALHEAHDLHRIRPPCARLESAEQGVQLLLVEVLREVAQHVIDVVFDSLKRVDLYRRCPSGHFSAKAPQRRWLLWSSLCCKPTG